MAKEEESARAGEELEKQLREWRKEQHLVAAQVTVLDDPVESRRPDDVYPPRYKSVPSGRCDSHLYGGVDVSFPESPDDPSVAVYVILRGDDVVYSDHEIFRLTVPYVSSYLSFREIDPLERLVKKQIAERPELTPEAILVDGNGIMHTRRAGIACFLGIRTGLKTIGVGKTLYCHDGIDHDLVKAGLENRSLRLLQCAGDDEKFRNFLKERRGLVVDGVCVDAADGVEDPLPSMPSMAEMMRDLSPMCNGFAVKLRGASEERTIWGAALVCHGGRIPSRGGKRRNRRQRRVGTKNPIFVSVGHNVSLEEAVRVCAELSIARIPEPIREADLTGRRLMREAGER